MPKKKQTEPKRKPWSLEYSVGEERYTELFGDIIEKILNNDNFILVRTLQHYLLFTKGYTWPEITYALSRMRMESFITRSGRDSVTQVTNKLLLKR